MESINNITYYTLNEALLWLYVDAAKQRYGDVNSTYWENALITVNKIPPSMEESYLKELLSRLSKPFVNFVPLTETESTFIKLLSDTFQASSNDSLLDKKPYINSLPPPLGEGASCNADFLISLKPDLNLPEANVEEYVSRTRQVLRMMAGEVNDDSKSTAGKILNKSENKPLYLLAAKIANPDILDLFQLEKIALSANALTGPQKWLGIIYEALRSGIRGINRDLLAILQNNLKRGQIRAIGYEYPIKSSSARREIPAEHWDILEFDENGHAEKDGYRYGNLLFKINTASAEPEQPMAPIKRGRGSKMDLIAEEMKRRASTGELDLRGLKAECNHLRKWCQKHHKQVYDAGSLEKKLGKLYRELVATHTKL